jgi:D-amino peptidase
MRVYLSIDMEGIAGVVHEDQTNPTDPRCAAEYGRFRRLMTLEANAAVEGALAGGASRVLVNDGHWSMRNLIAEELHPAAELVSGGPRTWSMMEGIDLGWDLAAFIGYHAKAGTQNAILDHTYSDRILDVRLNGRSVGELGINAALAGTFGVPVALVSGDRALAEEARALMGDGAPRTVVVKEAMSRHAARSVAPEKAQLMIGEAMRDVVARTAKGDPVGRAHVVASPTVVEVDFAMTSHADHAAMGPGYERRGPRTVAFRQDDYRDVFRAFRVMFNLGGAD